MLFYKYWKDKTFFKSLYCIDDGKHQELQFDGKTESFLFENVQDKLEIVREAMDRLENSPADEIMQEVYKFMRLDFFWNRIKFTPPPPFSQTSIYLSIIHKSVSAVLLQKMDS